MKQILNLQYATSLTDICKLNSSFDKATLRICYPGENRNRSYISKETLTKCVPTLFNCPLVTHYDRDTDSLGGHDIEVVKDRDDNLKIVNLTQPVGVVPSEAKVWFEDVEEDSGVVNEYLCTEVILWKRQEAYQKLKRDGITAHSMEISVKDGESIDGIYYIYDFEFNALCLLGVEPCFESSAMEFAMNEFKEQFAEMMQELKESYTNYSTEGGEQLENTEKIIEVEETAVDVTETAEETIETGVETTPAVEEPAPEEPAEPAEEEQTEEIDTPEEFNLTSNIVDELRRVLEEPTVETNWGETSNYWYVDSNLELSQVYCYDITDWLLYGFTYSTDGDAVTIDWSTKARKKFDIVDFEGEVPAGGIAMFSFIEQMLTDGASYKEKYTKAESKIADMNSELNTLRKYKQDIEKAEATATRQEVLDKFAKDLADVAEYQELVNNALDYELDALEDKCYALCGRHGIVAKFNASVKNTPKIKVGDIKEEEASKPYGGVVEKYRATQND